MSKKTYGYDANIYETTIGNIKDGGIKLEAKIPMFEEKELENFDNNIHNIVEEYSKMLFKEKDQILTQRIIMKQEDEIERLNKEIEKLKQENAVLKTLVVNKDKYTYGIR